MEKIGLIIIGSVGAYAFLRNNIGKLPDQIIVNIHPDIFYKTFIPLLMFGSAIAAFSKFDKKNFFYLSVFSLLIDAINRLGTLINFYYQCFIYGPIEEPTVSENSILVINSLAVSNILLLLEIVAISCISIHFWKYRFRLSQQRL
jgi:hypothetical protein